MQLSVGGNAVAVDVATDCAPLAGRTEQGTCACCSAMRAHALSQRACVAVPVQCNYPFAVAEDPFADDVMLIAGSCALVCPAPVPLGYIERFDTKRRM